MPDGDYTSWAEATLQEVDEALRRQWIVENDSAGWKTGYQEESRHSSSSNSSNRNSGSSSSRDNGSGNDSVRNLAAPYVTDNSDSENFQSADEQPQIGKSLCGSVAELSKQTHGDTRRVVESGDIAFNRQPASVQRGSSLVANIRRLSVLNRFKSTKKVDALVTVPYSSTLCGINSTVPPRHVDSPLQQAVPQGQPLQRVTGLTSVRRLREQQRHTHGETELSSKTVYQSESDVQTGNSGTGSGPAPCSTSSHTFAYLRKQSISASTPRRTQRSDGTQLNLETRKQAIIMAQALWSRTQQLSQSGMTNVPSAQLSKSVYMNHSLRNRAWHFRKGQSIGLGISRPCTASNTQQQNALNQLVIPASKAATQQKIVPSIPNSSKGSNPLIGSIRPQQILPSGRPNLPIENKLVEPSSSEHSKIKASPPKTQSLKTPLQRPGQRIGMIRSARQKKKPMPAAMRDWVTANEILEKNNVIDERQEESAALDDKPILSRKMPDRTRSPASATRAVRSNPDNQVGYNKKQFQLDLSATKKTSSSSGLAAQAAALAIRK